MGNNSVFRIIFLILLFNLCNTRLHSQEVISKNHIDSIKSSAVDFLIKEGYLSKDDSFQKHLKTVYFSELNSQAILGFNEFGIYALGVSISHTERFILFLNRDLWAIRSVKNLRLVLLDACDFFLVNKIPEDEMARYVERIIEVYRYNNSF